MKRIESTGDWNVEARIDSQRTSVNTEVYLHLLGESHELSKTLAIKLGTLLINVGNTAPAFAPPKKRLEVFVDYNKVRDEMVTVGSEFKLVI